MWASHTAIGSISPPPRLVCDARCPRRTVLHVDLACSSVTEGEETWIVNDSCFVLFCSVFHSEDPLNVYVLCAVLFVQLLNASALAGRVAGGRPMRIFATRQRFAFIKKPFLRCLVYLDPEKIPQAPFLFCFFAPRAQVTLHTENGPSSIGKISFIA